MKKRSAFTKLLLATSSFAGGLAIGLLLAPGSGKRNRAWIQTHASDVTDWIDKKGKQALDSGNRQLKHIRSQVQRNVKKNVPDLYHATEHIDLDEFDVVDG